MLVVDSSVWIDYMNDARTERAVRLDEVLGREPNRLVIGWGMACKLCPAS